MKRQGLFSLILVFLMPIASAQTTESRLADCAAVDNQQQRLACFDALARDVPEPTTPTDTGLAQVEKTPSTENFGLEHMDPNAGGAADLNAVVVGTGKNAMGKLVLTLDNGQVWQQKDSKRLVLHTGDSVLIERGALTAFYLSSGGNKRIAVARVK